MNNFFYFIFLALLFIPIVDHVFADTWKIQIPPGSSQIDFPVHFNPQEISIRPGDSVEWGNSDGEIHTVVSGSLETGVENVFDSGLLSTGQKFRHVFSEEGEFQYFCTIHPWMTGIVNVIDLPEGYSVKHNVGSDVSDVTFDIMYKVQRNLSDVQVDTARNMLVFNFVGKIDKDVFFVYLPQELIKDPQSVWVGDIQKTDFKSVQIGEITKLTISLEGHTTQVRIVGTDVIGEFTPKPHVLINQIFAVTDKQTYNPGDIITISGEIKNLSQLTHIAPNIIAPSGVILYAEPLTLIGSKFSVDISSDILHEFGQYKIRFEGKDIKTPVINFEYGLLKSHPSPKKQMASVEAGDVICYGGLELLMKVSNGNAICVTKSTANILLQRGWADYF